MALTNRQWVLRQRPQGLIQDGDLELVASTVPELKDGEVLVRTIYLSLDPTNRTWMNDAVGYLPPVGLGDVMRGLTLGVVEAVQVRAVQGRRHRHHGHGRLGRLRRRAGRRRVAGSTARPACR